jgi:transposase
MGMLIMSETERQMKAMMEMVRLGKLTLKQVAEQMEYSYKQIWRIYKRYKVKGDEGLVHKARGLNSNHKHPHRNIIIELYKTKYDGFGPTLAAEKLAKNEGYYINDETIRLWLLQEGLMNRIRKRKPYRQRRDRREQFGELIQIDGSIHDWFENGSKLCLFNMVDDATGINITRLELGETTIGIFRLLWRWIDKYGIPLAVYVDLKTVYVAPKELSYFQRVCKTLGIKVIKAYSAQAKGRVERKHAVYQDRLVKELRLRNIKNIDDTNVLLINEFDEEINKKFAKEASNPNSAHCSADNIDLQQVICWEFVRQVQNDWTFTLGGKYYQVLREDSKIVKAKAKICVRRHLDGSITAWHNNKKLSIELLSQRPVKVIEKKINFQAKTRSQCGKLGKQNSPWGRSYWLNHNNIANKAFNTTEKSVSPVG